jgi:hypothetical protein
MSKWLEGKVKQQQQPRPRQKKKWTGDGNDSSYIETVFSIRQNKLGREKKKKTERQTKNKIK